MTKFFLLAGILVDTTNKNNQKPTILQQSQKQQQAGMRTIYVSGLSGQYKTYVVTNNNPLTIQPIGFTSGPSISRSNEITVITPQKADSSQVTEQAQLVHHNQPIAQSRILEDIPNFVNDEHFKVTTSRIDTAGSGESIEVASSVSSVIPVPSQESLVEQVDIESIKPSEVENYSLGSESESA